GEAQWPSPPHKPLGRPRAQAVEIEMAVAVDDKRHVHGEAAQPLVAVPGASTASSSPAMRGKIGRGSRRATSAASRVARSAKLRRSGATARRSRSLAALWG